MPVLGGGGGGGTPINGLAPFYVPADTEDGYANVITTASGEVYLKTGVLETDASLYPDATTSDEPVSFVGTVDLNALTGGSSFWGLTYDGTHLWALSDGNENLYKLTTGSSPTYTGTAIALGADSWRGVAYDTTLSRFAVLSEAGNWKLFSTAGSLISSGTVTNRTYFDLTYNGSEYVALSRTNFASSNRAGDLYNLGSGLFQSTYITQFPTPFGSPSSLFWDGNKYWSGTAYGVFKHWGADNYSPFNPISNGGSGLAIAGSYFYVVSGSTLYVYNFDTTVVGIPAKLSSSMTNSGTAVYYWSYKISMPVPLYVRVK